MEVYLSLLDCRKLKYCIPGVRRFCIRHGLSFHKLLHGKMLIKEFEDTGDAMALKVVELAKERV